MKDCRRKRLVSLIIIVSSIVFLVFSAYEKTNASNDDGGLPSSESEAFDFSEEAREAANWLDANKADELRAQTLTAAKERRANWPTFREIDEKKAQSLGITRLESGHIVLYTDLDVSKEIRQIPEALDAAIPLLCKFFKVDEKRFQDWRVEAFLMGDYNQFIAIGAIDGPPEFLNGYSMGDRIFAKDQDLDYYERFLLLHELVHTFMHEVFGDLRPRWYSEGSAEYIALHRWDPKKKKLEIAQIPESEDATPGFFRLREIRKIVRENRAPTLAEILEFQPRDFLDVSTYAWSWAFVMFLNNSPKYQEIAELLPYWSIAEDPNKLFIDAIGERWNELENDWADFLRHIDYEYDFQTTSIEDFGTEGRALTTEESYNGIVVKVDPARGWQNTGIELQEGVEYALTLSGRFDFYLEGADRTFEFEGTGASCQYEFGKPVGRLEAVVVPNDARRSFEEVYAIASDKTTNSDGFRFNAFAQKRTRFIEDDQIDATGFPKSKAPEEKKSKEKKRDLKKGEKIIDRPLYNALYPWNEGIAFESAREVIAPKKTGALYLRVNSRPKNLKRNSGTFEVDIREADAPK